MFSFFHDPTMFLRFILSCFLRIVPDALLILHVLGRLRTPVREAFSYGIRHIFHCDSMKYKVVLHWITINHGIKHAVSRMKMSHVRESATSLLPPAFQPVEFTITLNSFRLRSSAHIASSLACQSFDVFLVSLDGYTLFICLFFLSYYCPFLDPSLYRFFLSQGDK